MRCTLMVSLVVLCSLQTYFSQGGFTHDEISCDSLFNCTRLFIDETTYNCGPYSEAIEVTPVETYYGHFDFDNSTFPAGWIKRLQNNNDCGATPSGEEQVFRDQNVYFDSEGGTNFLRLKGEILTTPLRCSVPIISEERWVASGHVYYEGTGQNFGKYVIRARFPDVVGWWPAIWATHRGEVDIAEVETQPNKEDFYANIYDSYTYSDEGFFCNTRVTVDGDFLGDWREWTFEWTPFKMEISWDGNSTKNTIYRLYDGAGNPVDPECGEIIPAGYYREDPNYFTTRGNWLHFQAGLAVLPACCGNCKDSNGRIIDPNSNCEFAGQRHSIPLSASGECGDKDANENPNTSTCETGYTTVSGSESPAFLDLDYLYIDQRDYLMDGGLRVQVPEYVCLNTPVEIPIFQMGNRKGKDAYHGVDVISLSVTTMNGNVVIKDTDSGGTKTGSLEFTLTNSSLGFADIQVEYKDWNLNQHTAEFRVKVAGESHSNVSVAYEECSSDFTVTIYIPGFCSSYTLEREQPDPNGDLWYEGRIEDPNGGTVMLLDVVVNSNNQMTFHIPFEFYKNTVNDEDYDIVVDLEFVDACGQQRTVEIRRDVINCNRCCPSNTDLIDGKCVYDIEIPEGWVGHVYDNKFFLYPQCPPPCCPSGYGYDGHNCYSGLSFEPHYTGHVDTENGQFYVDMNCNLCCPRESDYNGYTCYIDDVPLGYSAIEIDGIVYYKSNDSNCDVGPGEDPPLGCCPFGYIPVYMPGVGYVCDGAMKPVLPEGYTPDLGNKIAVEPNCNQCCPTGFEESQEGCVLRESFAPGFERVLGTENIGGETKTVVWYKPNCHKTRQNHCCPPKTHYIGGICRPNNENYVVIPETNGNLVILNNQIFTDKVVCSEPLQNDPEAIETSQNKSSEVKLSQNILSIRPNPTKDVVFVEAMCQGEYTNSLLLMDQMGRPIKSYNVDFKFGKDYRSIQLDNIAPGVYILQLNCESGRVYQKLLVQ